MKGGETVSLKKEFRKATRQKIKASIMIEGLTGKGKSGLALAIAHTLADTWEDIYAIDTENMALDLFDNNKMHFGIKVSGLNKVDLTAEEGYAPSNYMALRKTAIQAGAKVVIMDSISHMWTREGGVLDKVSQISGAATKNFNAWNDLEVSKEKNLIFDLVRSSDTHIITTVRSKEKFSLEYDETKGKNQVVSLGEQQIQQDGLKYEPDLVLRMVSPGNDEGTAPVATVLKSRYSIFKEGLDYTFDEKILSALKQYVMEGVDPDVIREQQRQDYISSIKEFGKSSALNMSLYKEYKKAAGYEAAKLEDIPYNDIRKLHILISKE